jgi:hypothetical protein
MASRFEKRVKDPNELFYVGQYLRFRDEWVVVNRVDNDWYLLIRGTFWDYSLLYPCCHLMVEENRKLCDLA